MFIKFVYQNGKVGLRSYSEALFFFFFLFKKPCYFKNWKYFKDLLLIIIHPPLLIMS